MDILLVMAITIAVLVFIVTVHDISYHNVKRFEKAEVVLVLPIYENTSAELRVRNTLSQYEKSDICLKKLILLDCGMSQETRKICELLCGENSVLDIVKIGDMDGYFSQMLKYENKNDIIKE